MQFVDFFKLKLPDQKKIIVRTNLTDSEFVAKHQLFFQQPNGAYASLGKLPHECQGLRRVLRQPQSLDANYRSMLATESTDMHARRNHAYLVGLDFLREQTHSGPLYQDFGQSAREHKSEMAAKVAQGMSLVLGQSVQLLHKCQT